MKQLMQLLIFLFLTRLGYAGEVDHRFEGIWVGVETFEVPANFMQRGEAPFQKPVVIAIGDSGKLVGVVQGVSVGRYQIWEQRTKGNTLGFRRFGPPNLDVGRHEGTLTLSPDGNTLTEKGFALMPGTPNALMCHIAATLHRQGKK